jgi:hypothetical protein
VTFPDWGHNISRIYLQERANMDNKSFYYLSSWDDAAVYTRVLDAVGIPHAIEAPGGIIPIDEGQLALVFPHLTLRQYKSVRELFGAEAVDYPAD